MDIVVPAAPATGTGTTGTLAKWTSTSTLGNSIVSEVTTVLTIAGTVLSANGSAATPTYSFASATDLGLYRISTTALGVTVGGTLRFTFGNALLTSTVPIQLPVGSSSSPSIRGALAASTGIRFPATDTIECDILGNATWSLNATTMTLIDAVDLVVGTTTGTKIGTATSQKIGFYNATPVVQRNTTGTATGFVSNFGTAVKDDSTFTGGLGATAYRLSDLVLALKQLGLIAQ